MLQIASLEAECVRNGPGCINRYTQTQKRDMADQQRGNWTSPLSAATSRSVLVRRKRTSISAILTVVEARKSWRNEIVGVEKLHFNRFSSGSFDARKHCNGP